MDGYSLLLFGLAVVRYLLFVNAEETQLLRVIASTIGSLGPRVLTDLTACGSVLTLSIALEALLACDAPAHTFNALHASFSIFPHDETPQLELLFGGLLEVCVLAQHFDRSAAVDLTDRLFSVWREVQPATSN